MGLRRVKQAVAGTVLLASPIKHRHNSCRPWFLGRVSKTTSTYRALALLLLKTVSKST